MLARLAWLIPTRVSSAWWLAFAVLSVTPIAAFASGPEIEFDLTPVVECQDVTPPEFAETHPDQRIIEAVLRVSMRLKSGAARDVREITLEIASPDQSLLVFDFSPELVLESSVAGEIQVTKTQESGSTIGAGLNGGTGIPYGGVTVNVSPHATIGTSKRNLETEVAKRIPDKDVVLVGGTMNNGYGVFFKFRPSGQTPLEGRKEFIVRYVVPRTWRGDWLLVSTRAIGEHKEYFLKSIKESGKARWQLGLYLEEDREARTAAWRLAAAQGLISPRRAAAIKAPTSTRALPETNQAELSSPRNASTVSAVSSSSEEKKPGTSWASFLPGLLEFDSKETSTIQTSNRAEEAKQPRPLTPAERQLLARNALRRLSQAK